MEPPDRIRRSTSRSRGRRRRSRFLKAVSQVWSEWNIEILMVMLMAIAVFLLVERMHIRLTLTRWLELALGSLATVMQRGIPRLTAVLRSIGPSDKVGLILLVVAAVVVVRRVRWRLLTMPRFTTKQCPRCGGDLHRIHRTGLDRVLNKLVPLRRYICCNRDCRWRGLRTGKSRPS